MTTALVAGAGIVGLTTALTLRHAGLKVTVAERAPEIRALGTSLGLWRNALSVYDGVNILDAITAIGRPNTMAFHDATGRLVEIPGADAADQTLLLVNRREFSTTLADAVGADGIRLASAVAGYTEHPKGVTVQFSDGTSGDFDLLVGADGINSAVRQRLLPGSGAIPHVGHHNWRAVTSPTRPIDQDVMVIGNEGCRGGYARTRDGRIYWLIAQLGAPDPTDSPKADALSRAPYLDDGGWNDRLLDIIADTPAELVIHSPISIVPPLPRWNSDRVVLVGDAAHAMSPHITAGATLGIEDAAALARHLSAATSIEDGLAAYSTTRIPRYQHAAQLSAAVADYGSADEYAARYAAFSQWMISTGEGGVAAVA